MVFLGLALIILGGIAILSAIFVSEPGSGGELLGFDVTTLESFLVGVAAGAAIMWGFTILKSGARLGAHPHSSSRQVWSGDRHDHGDVGTRHPAAVQRCRVGGRDPGRLGARVPGCGCTTERGEVGCRLCPALRGDES